MCVICVLLLTTAGLGEIISSGIYALREIFMRVFLCLVGRVMLTFSTKVTKSFSLRENYFWLSKAFMGASPHTPQRAYGP